MPPAHTSPELGVLVVEDASLNLRIACVQVKANFKSKQTFSRITVIGAQDFPSASALINAEFTGNLQEQQALCFHGPNGTRLQEPQSINAPPSCLIIILDNDLGGEHSHGGADLAHKIRKLEETPNYQGPKHVLIGISSDKDKMGSDSSRSSTGRGGELSSDENCLDFNCKKHNLKQYLALAFAKAEANYKTWQAQAKTTNTAPSQVFVPPKDRPKTIPTGGFGQFWQSVTDKLTCCATTRKASKPSMKIS